ncbi:hypothetical protein AB0I98_02440 [Streptomyces sp. NPDC050211]|uniref:SCO4225 family membrane protein n=1 Tax=Streptomyces sp. NPDC050211 TaxID=3154932 RepID=UPI003431738C
MTASGRSLPRILRLALSDIVARVYLAICSLLLVGALAVTVADSSDESMAGVIPLLATAPVSLLLLALPDNGAMLVVAVVIGALVNATIIGCCARALRGGGSTDQAS